MSVSTVFHVESLLMLSASFLQAAQSHWSLIFGPCLTIFFVLAGFYAEAED
jgi:hypothetical protein